MGGRMGTGEEGAIVFGAGKEVVDGTLPLLTCTQKVSMTAR